MKVVSIVSRYSIVVATVMSSTIAWAVELDLRQTAFNVTWRQRVTGNQIGFDRDKLKFKVEFGGSKFREYNTSDATYSRCSSGRDGGANLCVSGRMFDCAFHVTMSTGNEAHLDLRRSDRGDELCRGMSGEYVILVD